MKDLPKSSDVEIGEIAQSNDAFLTYCLENSVTKDHQQKGVVTGIVFRGEILDNEGTNVGTIYKYANQYFRSMDALKSVYPAYKAENLVTYTDGYCYYSHLSNISKETKTICNMLSCVTTSIH